MTWRVLVSAPYLQPVIDRFRPFFDEHGMEVIVPPVQERLGEEELLEWITDVDGVVCGDDALTRRVLEAAPRLRVISKWGTGIDSIDQEAATELGVKVCNTPNAFSEPVADTVMGYVLSFARQIPFMDRQMKGGSWDKLPGISLGEATLGVIGVGNCGTAVLKRAKAFGMRLLGNDIRAIPGDVVSGLHVEMVGKEQLLEESDFVSLNCDLNPTSYHLMGEERFGRMKTTACVINTSRGPVIDQDALVAALRGRAIRGAALDVFEIEPLPDDDPLRTFDHVLLAPHNANSSPAAWERVHERTLTNLLDALREGG